MYYCVDLTLEQCVPPNVSSDGTFIDGALYAYFILTVICAVTKLSAVCDFMEI